MVVTHSINDGNRALQATEIEGGEPSSLIGPSGLWHIHCLFPHLASHHLALGAGVIMGTLQQNRVTIAPAFRSRDQKGAPGK